MILSSFFIYLCASTALPTKTDREVLRTFVLYHLRSGHYDEALATTKDFLRRFPQDKDAKHMSVALQSHQPQSLLFDLESQTNWSLQLETKSGYNSNVLLLSEETLNAISRSETQSAFFAVGSSFMWRMSKERNRLGFGHFLNLKDYVSDEADDLSGLSGKGSLFYETALTSAWSSGLEAEALYSFLYQNDFDLFLVRPELSAKLEFEPNENNLLKLKAGVGHHRYGSDESRSGAEFLSEFKWFRQAFAARWQLGLAFSESLAESNVYHSRTLRLPVSWARKWDKRWKTSAQTSYRYVLYPKSPSERFDHILGIDLEHIYQIFARFDLKVQYGFLKSFSSESANSYNRHEVSAGISYVY